MRHSQEKTCQTFSVVPRKNDLISPLVFLHPSDTPEKKVINNSMALLLLVTFIISKCLQVVVLFNAASSTTDRLYEELW